MPRTDIAADLAEPVDHQCLGAFPRRSDGCDRSRHSASDNQDLRLIQNGDLFLIANCFVRDDPPPLSGPKGRFDLGRGRQAPEPPRRWICQKTLARAKPLG